MTGEVAQRNKLLLEIGAAKAVVDGIIRLEDFAKVDAAIRAIKLHMMEVKTLDGPL